MIQNNCFSSSHLETNSINHDYFQVRLSFGVGFEIENTKVKDIVIKCELSVNMNFTRGNKKVTIYIFNLFSIS